LHKGCAELSSVKRKNDFKKTWGIVRIAKNYFSKLIVADEIESEDLLQICFVLIVELNGTCLVMTILWSDELQEFYMYCGKM
jgi:hypothetical protein